MLVAIGFVKPAMSIIDRFVDCLQNLTISMTYSCLRPLDMPSSGPWLIHTERAMKNSKSEFSARVLMSLVTDLAEFEESAKRIRIQIQVLAKEHGVKIPRRSKA
jgi:hypothetical protein